MLINKPDGTIEKVDLGGKKVTLKQLQDAVGGLIEAVPGTKHRVWCNEEGILLKLELNKPMSEKYNMLLLGNVVEMEKGERQ